MPAICGKAFPTCSSCPLYIVKAGLKCWHESESPPNWSKFRSERRCLRSVVVARLQSLQRSSYHAAGIVQHPVVQRHWDIVALCCAYLAIAIERVVSTIRNVKGCEWL